MEEPYSERVNKLFQRISNIQTDVEEEKSNRFKALKAVLLNFEKKIEEHQKSRHDRFDQLFAKLKDLQNLLDEDITIRTNMEVDLATDLKNLENTCQSLIAAHLKESDEQSRRFLARINKQIEQVSLDIASTFGKQETQAYLQILLDETLPKLKDDLDNEIATRKEIETRIYEQFMDQINNLNESLEDERKERERRSDQFMQLLKKVASKINDNLNRNRSEREKNEEMMVGLIEKVVDRIKKDALELTN